MKLCFELPEYQIKLEQRADKSFRVTYGLQVTDHLSYESAAKELGDCIMHALFEYDLIDDSED